MKMNHRFIYGILSIVLAAVIAFIAVPAITSKTSSTREIVRMKTAVGRGTLITAEDVELIEAGGFNMPESVASKTEAVACCFSGFFAPFVYCALFMFRCYPVFKGLSQPRSEPHASSFRISCPVPWCCTFPCVLSGMPPVLLLFSCRRIRQDCFFLLRCAISERLL